MRKINMELVLLYRRFAETFPEIEYEKLFDGGRKSEYVFVRSVFAYCVMEYTHYKTSRKQAEKIAQIVGKNYATLYTLIRNIKNNVDWINKGHSDPELETAINTFKELYFDNFTNWEQFSHKTLKWTAKVAKKNEEGKFQIILNQPGFEDKYQARSFIRKYLSELKENELL